MCTASTRVPGQLCSLFLTSSIRAGCHHNSSFGPVPPERTAGYVSRSAKKTGPAFVCFVAEKMSSNFFFRVWPSARGQLESSWCTNTTFSNTACTETP